jgi:hypothetical protein
VPCWVCSRVKFGARVRRFGDSYAVVRSANWTDQWREEIYTLLDVQLGNYFYFVGIVFGIGGGVVTFWVRWVA